MKKKTLLFTLVMLVGFFLPDQVEAQCSMCRAVLESEEGQATAKGINDGIVYLMAIPYLLVAGVGFVVYRMMHK
ncbi:MAG: hypothetical protein ACPGC8_06240 [Flavobacteriaceae bacterium]